VNNAAASQILHIPEKGDEDEKRVYLRAGLQHE
jgi:hypothetical protein